MKLSLLCEGFDIRPNQPRYSHDKRLHDEVAYLLDAIKHDYMAPKNSRISILRRYIQNILDILPLITIDDNAEETLVADISNVASSLMEILQTLPDGPIPNNLIEQLHTLYGLATNHFHTYTIWRS